tara:strand:+ start:1960 stop:2436 length:477 start_codon:yes stop_codon:yes gene_type:complete
MKLKFYKIRENAKLPARAHSIDAGMDLFYCPDPNQDPDCYWQLEGEYRIPPGESCLVPTGLKVIVPNNHMLEIKNKSGVAHKQKLIVGACVVDPGYTGEVLVNLHNIGGATKTIQPGQKIAQAVLIPVMICKVEETDEDPSLANTDRSDGGFGSTGLI